MRELDTQSKGESLEKTASENTLLDWVAHDLRAGLVPLKTYAQMLSTGVLGPINERQSDALHAIDHCAQRQADKIASVLDLVKAVEDRLERQFDTVNLPEIIDHALAHAKRDGKRRGISILTDYEPGAALIDADVNRIERVISILTSRAVKQSAEKSQVGVELQYVSDNRARIRIWDNGSGKARHELDVLNKSCADLMRALPTHSLPDLDLVPIRDILAAHKGTIRAESIEGNGTTILIYLPLKQRSKKKDAPQTKPSALIIHRDPEQVRELSRVLAEKSFNIQTVTTGKQALHVARSSRFQLVFLGLMEDQPTEVIRAGVVSQRPEDSLFICRLAAEGSTSDSSDGDQYLSLKANSTQIESILAEYHKTTSH